MRNSMTSPYLWVLCLLSIMPAVLWWDATRILTGFLLLFMMSYVLAVLAHRALQDAALDGLSALIQRRPA